jgi:hypothetical protein
LAQPAVAGAWTQAPGDQQWIASISREENDFGEAWRADDLVAFGFEGGWGANIKVESELRTPGSVLGGGAVDDRLGFHAGVQKSFALGERASFSVMVSYLGGESIDGPDCEGGGYEMRAALGTSFALGGREGFVNVETAAKSRGEGCDRRAWEVAAGIEVAPKWQVIAKGWTEQGSYADSTKAEAMLLHDFGSLSMGLGWREEVSGEFEEKGWVVSAWKTF